MKNIKLKYAIFACFVFAIMTFGSTYAYLTATTTSSENAVMTGSTIYSISMEITPVPEYTGFSFIPMNDEDALKALKNKCKDKYDRGACSAYQIRVYDYSKDLGYISGYIEFLTDNMENLSYMVLEEREEDNQENCATIASKNYCISKEATAMVKNDKTSIGDSYNVLGLSEKHLLLVVWLSNLDQNQNSTDIGNFNATVTIQAGSGGEIKGTIASAFMIDNGSSSDNTDNSDNTDSIDNP